MIDILQKITLERTARNWTEYQLALKSGFRNQQFLPGIERICFLLLHPWLKFVPLSI